MAIENMKDVIGSALKESADVKTKIADMMVDQIEAVTQTTIDALKAGNKILACGCGGSAADSQHFAAEFINRFRYDRDPLPAVALTTDTSVLTCIGNDSSFDYVFSKQVFALGQKGDVLFAISTSGNSPSILNAITEAKKKGMVVVGLTGKDGGKMKEMDVDHLLVVPSDVTARIQEGHLAIEHIVCDLVEQEMFPQ